MRVGAAALLMRDGRVLLGHRSAERDYYPDVWDLIGGHVEPGETPEEALVREVREETGAIPEDYRLLRVLSEPDPERHGAGEFHVFVVTAWSGVPRANNSEHDRLAWFTLEQARGLSLAHPAYEDLFSIVGSA